MFTSYGSYIFVIVCVVLDQSRLVLPVRWAELQNRAQNAVQDETQTRTKKVPLKPPEISRTRTRTSSENR